MGVRVVRLALGSLLALRRAVVACVLMVGLIPVVDVSGVAAQDLPPTEQETMTRDTPSVMM